ncbi:site-specific integrase [Nocardia cyriacigeorgica]|uniref:site-specific integrase n=1 Tax=Nocardia cyriacigeorgica TaxID=135487 RepID=UPI001895CE62|nr:site-specific integrase [Nocardia cyriacigeorgica]MBF6082901.1 site-specific integrase [Nocardia cyriacigeorgica]
MAGRPPLRIGAHGKIKRTNLGGGVWLARCRFRDGDGVTRIVERQSPEGEYDQRGQLAENVLIAALEERRALGGDDEVTGETTVLTLCNKHIQNLVAKGRATRTIDTYKDVVKVITPRAGAVRAREATAGRMDKAIQQILADQGYSTAKQARTVLRGALQLAVVADVLPVNPIDSTSRLERKAPPKGAPPVTAEQLAQLLSDLRTSKAPWKGKRTVADYCRTADLADPITMLIGTGLRRGELLGLRWRDIDEQTGIASIRGKVIRKRGAGLIREDFTKTAAGYRQIQLPRFVLDMLKRRRTEPHPSDFGVIFPSSAGTLRDPDNFNGQWRDVRALLLPDVPDVSSHSFRKALATMIDDAALSARVGADQLGHRHVSMTQDVYFGRGRIHPEVTDVLDKLSS